MLNSNKNQAKKIVPLLGLILALFLFSVPVFASYDCLYTTSTGDLVCDDTPFLNLQTLLNWIVVLMSFLCVFWIVLLIMNLR